MAGRAASPTPGAVTDGPRPASRAPPASARRRAGPPTRPGGGRRARRARDRDRQVVLVAGDAIALAGDPGSSRVSTDRGCPSLAGRPCPARTPGGRSPCLRGTPGRGAAPPRRERPGVCSRAATRFRSRSSRCRRRRPPATCATRPPEFEWAATLRASSAASAPAAPAAAKKRGVLVGAPAHRRHVEAGRPAGARPAGPGDDERLTWWRGWSASRGIGGQGDRRSDPARGTPCGCGG